MRNSTYPILLGCHPDDDDDDNMPMKPVKAVEEDDMDEMEAGEINEDMPVIQLESCHNGGGGESNKQETKEEEEDEVDEVFVLDETIQEGIPEASLAHTASVRDVEYGESCRPGEEQQGQRAEFLGVVLAPFQHKGTPIGIRFFADRDGVVSRIVPGSLLSPAPVRQGDKLLSVDGKRCDHLTSKEIARRIREHSSGYLNLVFHNESKDADPNLVECMLTKRTPEDVLGLRLVATPLQEGGGGGGEIRITHIVPDGVTSQSLLNVGDTLLQVNELSCDTSITTAQEVADTLRDAPQHVFILARPGEDTAMVVAEVSSRRANSNIRITETANRPTIMTERQYGITREYDIKVVCVNVCGPLLVCMAFVVAAAYDNRASGNP